MPRASKLSHLFVETVPDALSEGVLYVSMEYATTIHLCACGCKNEIVLPLSPTDWKMTYNGETISIWPSVGNWSLPCRSHYIIDAGRIRWAQDWSEEQIELGRHRDQRRKAAWLADEAEVGAPTPQPEAEAVTSPPKRPRSWLHRLINWRP